MHRIVRLALLTLMLSAEAASLPAAITGGRGAAGGVGHVPRLERGGGFSVAFSAQSLLPPPGVPCPPVGCAGGALVMHGEHRVRRMAVTCLSVHGPDAFLGLREAVGDLIVLHSAYARDGGPFDGRLIGDRFAFLENAALGCSDPHTQRALRESAAPVIGDVVVAPVCREPVVCTA